MTMCLRWRAAVAAAAGILGLTALAGGDPPPPPTYDLDWFTVDTGGGTSTFGDYSLSGTIGQPDAGLVLAGAGYGLTGGYWAAPGTCPLEYNQDGFLNLDDLGDFITDFYTVPAIPGGLQPSAPTYTTLSFGLSVPCPNAGDAPLPYDVNAYRDYGYRVGFSVDGGNSCPQDPEQPFPNLDQLGDFITAFYNGGC
jgi:hypothetical protein